MKSNKLLLVWLLFILPVIGFTQKELLFDDLPAKPRTVLIEVFTSSTCPPCSLSNSNLKNVLDQYQGRYSLIKYQMNFPGLGDPYYTDECGIRGGVYSVTSIPHIRIDGSQYSSVQSTVLDNLQNTPAQMELDVEYSLTGKTVHAIVTITPKTNLSNPNLQLYIGIVEKRTTKNFKSNGEVEFFQVMKKMMPDEKGTAVGNLTANVPVVFEEEWEFKGNYRLPADSYSPINHDIEHSVEDFDNLTIVAWVQDKETRVVLQSCYPSPFSVKYGVENGMGTITASANGNPITNGGTVNTTTEVTFTATPAQWYEVKGWKCYGNVVPQNSTNTFTTVVDRNTHVLVEFQPTHYKVNFNTDGPGTLVATVDGEEIKPNDMISKGAQIIFKATPAEGYEIKAWKNNDVTIFGNLTPEYTIPVLNDDANVTVEFQTSHLNVQYGTVNEYGTITATADLEEFESDALIKRGARIVFTAHPNELHNVAEWRNNGILIPGNTSNEYVINELSSNASVTVKFTDKLKIKDQLLSECSIFPNPTTGELRITISDSNKGINPLVLEIFDIYGRNLTPHTSYLTPHTSFDVSHLPSGVYFVKIATETGETIKKLVKY